MKKCICGAPVETRDSLEYSHCYTCWWAEDSRSSVDQKLKWLKEHMNNINSKDIGDMYWKIFDQIEDIEKSKIDLSLWMDMTSEQLDHDMRDFHNKYDWAMLDENRTSPKGNVYFDALMELKEEKDKYEMILRFLDNSGRSDLKDKIVNILEDITEWAECGCCVESGGNYTVMFNDGKSLVFDRTGSEIGHDKKILGLNWLKIKR